MLARAASSRARSRARSIEAMTSGVHGLTFSRIGFQCGSGRGTSPSGARRSGTPSLHPGPRRQKMMSAGIPEGRSPGTKPRADSGPGGRRWAHQPQAPSATSPPTTSSALKCQFVFFGLHEAGIIPGRRAAQEDSRGWSASINAGAARPRRKAPSSPASARRPACHPSRAC